MPGMGLLAVDDVVLPGGARLSSAIFGAGRVQGCTQLDPDRPAEVSCWRRARARSLIDTTREESMPDMRCSNSQATLKLAGSLARSSRSRIVFVSPGGTSHGFGARQPMVEGPLLPHHQGK